jgi:Methyltransferase domain
VDIDGHLFLVDTVAKMHRYVRVSGWFHHDESTLTRIELKDIDALSADIRTGFDHGGVLPDLGPEKGFSVEILLREDEFPEAGKLVFRTSLDVELTIKLTDLISDRRGRSEGSQTFRQFRDRVAMAPGACLLDVGGRDRSEVGDRKEFPGARVTVIDVLPGQRVDIVGDAHGMSDLFPADHFDFVHSRSVFEHLLMPWKVVLEINKVLKPGGLVFISTHQTIGLHDQPWDFLRFSKDAWPGFFNPATGFEILAAYEELPQFIIPWLWSEGKRFAEGSVGFEASGVLARKTGPSTLEWPVSTADVIETAYPDVPDGNES